MSVFKHSDCVTSDGFSSRARRQVAATHSHEKPRGAGNDPTSWFSAFECGDTSHGPEFLGRGVCLRSDRPAGVARVLATSVSGARLYLDARLLGLESGRLLLGARNVGVTAAGRLPMDARLLGILGRILQLAPGLLGADDRLLRWH